MSFTQWLIALSWSHNGPTSLLKKWERQKDRESERGRNTIPCMSMYVCLVTTTTGHKWEVIPDKWFCLKSRSSLRLLSYHLGPWWSRWPLGYLAPLKMWNLSSTHTSHQENYRAVVRMENHWLAWGALGASQKLQDDVSGSRKRWVWWSCHSFSLAQKEHTWVSSLHPRGSEAKVQWTLGTPGTIPAPHI